MSYPPPPPQQQQQQEQQHNPPLPAAPVPAPSDTHPIAATAATTVPYAYAPVPPDAHAHAATYQAAAVGGVPMPPGYGHGQYDYSYYSEYNPMQAAIQMPHMVPMPPIPMPEAAGDSSAKAANVLPINGGSKTMNLDPIVYRAIIGSDYFKGTLSGVTDFSSVIREIENEVEHLDPYMHTVSIPRVSSAYILMFKLFSLKLTRKQMWSMLHHKGSVFVRALGFLYLRYTCPPRDLWEWFEESFDDAEEVYVHNDSQHGYPLGSWLADILLMKRHCGTILPRIPIPILRRLREQLTKKAEEIDEDNTEHPLRLSAAIRDALSGSSARDEHTSAARSVGKTGPGVRMTMAPVRGDNRRVDEEAAAARGREKSYRDRERHTHHDYGRHSGRRDDHHRSRSRSRDGGSRRRWRDRSADRDRERDRYSHKRSRSRSRSRDRQRSQSPRRAGDSIEQEKEKRSRLEQLQSVYGDGSTTGSAVSGQTLLDRLEASRPTGRIVVKQPSALEKYRMLHKSND